MNLDEVIACGIPSNETDARHILGVTDSADYRTIRKAYRGLAGQIHPDRFADDPSQSAQATEAMQIVNAAWEIIEALHKIGSLGRSQQKSRSGRTSRANRWQAVARAPNADECDLCGSWPAKPVRIRSLSTILIWFSPGKFDGTTCQSCGTALLWNALRRTMIGGWWGIATIATPIYLLTHLNMYLELSSMSPPSFRDVNVATPFRGPVTPPRNPLKSVGPLLATGIAVFIFGWFVYTSATTPTSSQRPSGDARTQTTPADDTFTPSISVGSCMRDSGVDMVARADCSGDHDYVVDAIVRSPEACPASTQYAANVGAEIACLRVR